MKKTEFVVYLSEKTGRSKREVADIINEVFEGITEVVAGGDDVQISGFGEFGIKPRAARRSVNLRAIRDKNESFNDMVSVPAARKVYFKVGSNLRARVMENFKNGKN